jgi:hypothetical protein
MASLRYCVGCRVWHPKFSACPECGGEARFNKGLWTGVLNSQLYDQARQAHKDGKKAEFVAKGGLLPAEPWAKKRAKELVDQIA